ncbi:MAG: hypothetical protein IJO08_03745 [Clostridia bacterium]|nr:hypothetical protein [Clostridia bacterium]
MRKITSKHLKVGLIALVVIIVVVGIFGGKKNIGPNTKYDCDVKNLRLSTDIVISSGGEKVSQVTGNIFRIVEEPLTMKDESGNKIAYAGDDYHLIAQDSHVIIQDGVVAAEMVGKFDLFGETYDIYNASGEKIARAKFNWSDTYGTLYDTTGNLIADYDSFIFFNDFDVRISEKCEISHNTVLMIFCSYYSDQKYDSEE